MTQTDRVDEVEEIDRAEIMQHTLEILAILSKEPAPLKDQGDGERSLAPDLLSLGWDQLHSVDAQMRRCRRPLRGEELPALRSRIETLHEIYSAISLWHVPEFREMSRELWYLITSLKERAETLHTWQIEDKKLERGNAGPRTGSR